MRNRTSEHDALEQAAAVLEPILGSLKIVEAAGDSSVDATGYHSGHRVAVQVKHLETMRIRDLEGQLAAGVLALQRHSSAGEIPLVVIVTRRFAARAEHAANQFMDTYAPGVGWCLLARDGRLRLKAPDLGLDLREQANRPPPPPRATTIHLFTDLNRWLLKVMLMRAQPPTSWGGPRSGLPYRNPTELHRVAGVSLETAHRFVRTFEGADFIRRAPEGLRIVRAEALFEQWLHDERTRTPMRMPARGLYGSVERNDLLMMLEATGTRHAIGGYAACAELGLLHATRQQLDIHVDTDAAQALLNMELEACEPRDAMVWIVRSRYRESVFRGATQTDQAPVVDELQAALDVIHDPGRGNEQAKFIVSRLLASLEQS